MHSTEYDRTWWVVGPSHDGTRRGFCRGHDDEDAARQDAEERTRRARALGIVVLYKHVLNPERK